MRRATQIALVAVPVTVLLAGGAVWALTRGGSAPAGAERVADATGPVEFRSAGGMSAEDEGLTLDDLELGTVTYLRTDQDGDLVLAADGPFGGFSNYLVRASRSGHVLDVGAAMVDHAGAFGMSADRHYATAGGNDQASRIVIVPPAWVPPDEGLYFDGPRPTVRGEPLPRGEVDIGAVEVVDSDTVLLGSRWGPIIDEASADGSSVRLLGPHGDPDARVTTDPAVGAIVSLVRLDDDRVVFVAESDDGYQLHLLDGEAVEALGREGADRNPVAAPDAQSYPAHHPTDPLPVGARWDRRAMAPLAPGPDGQVITVGAGEDRVPEISLVDIDTGDVEVLARLDGVEATIEEPVVATIVDDDLVFTAEGSLWRLPDVMPAEE